MRRDQGREEQHGDDAEDRGDRDHHPTITEPHPVREPHVEEIEYAVRTDAGPGTGRHRSLSHRRNTGLRDAPRDLARRLDRERWIARHRIARRRATRRWLDVVRVRLI